MKISILIKSFYMTCLLLTFINYFVKAMDYTSNNNNEKDDRDRRWVPVMNPVTGKEKRWGNDKRDVIEITPPPVRHVKNLKNSNRYVGWSDAAEEPVELPPNNIFIPKGERIDEDIEEDFFPILPLYQHNAPIAPAFNEEGEEEDNIPIMAPPPIVGQNLEEAPLIPNVKKSIGKRMKRHHRHYRKHIKKHRHHKRRSCWRRFWRKIF